jgi:mannosylglycoprotein endo-beta-mannosidase
MKIYEEEEMYWFSRSSERWLLEGDNNTAYFHRVANGRKRKNTMYSLKKDDINIQGTTDLLVHATDYYKQLFGHGEGNKMQLADSIWSAEEKLSEEDNRVLLEPFTEEEVHLALKMMVKNKAPGPDGVPVEFYQACWPLVKHDIMRLFNDWQTGVLNLYRLNFGMIILLQKSPEADVIQKYRPICLLQVLYKLLTKVATLRVELSWTS